MAPLRASSTPIPTTETAAPAGSESTLTDEQWEAAQEMLKNVYNHRTDDGYDPSKIFHRKVNKRVLPDYYDVIEEPMALSTIKAKIAAREYPSRLRELTKTKSRASSASVSCPSQRAPRRPSTPTSWALQSTAHATPSKAPHPMINMGSKASMKRVAQPV